MPQNRMGTRGTVKLGDGGDGDVVSICEKVLTVFTQRMEERFDSLERSIKEIKKISSDNQQRIISLENRLDDLEQYSRRNSLRLYGVPEEAGENTNVLVLDIFNSTLNVNLSTTDIDRTHRIGRTSEKKPRAIIIKFVSYQSKSLVYLNKKKFKGSKIVLREDLTRKRLDVYMEAVSRYGLRRVNTRDGKIVVRSVPDDDGASKVLFVATSLSELQ